LVVNDSSDAQFIIPLLFERGTPVDALNKNGQTAIYCAVAAENFELASLLLKKGADINQQNNSGRTSLMAASSEKMMSFLLERGANPNIQDSDGKTALMDCGGKTEIIHLLFHAGANPTLKDNKGRTVLHYWISDLDGPMIDDLISRGLLIDEPDNEGRTPLISAIDRSRRVTLLLLEKGADPNYRGPKGRTALHFYLLDIENQYRYKSENIERDQPVITALLEAGTRPADKDDDGDSALITAFRIAQKDKNTTTLTDLVQRYADAEEIKIATDTARKMISTEKREYRREELSENLPPTIKALSVPLILGGLGFVMSSVVFKNNPSDNIMGLLNGMLTLGGVGATLGFFLGVASYKGSGVWNDMFGPAVNGVIGGIIGGVAGIIVACLPSVRKAFTNNQVLYYTPTAVSAVTVSVIIFHIWN
jgi:ankyrin repeat protein